MHIPHPLESLGFPLIHHFAMWACGPPHERHTVCLTAGNVARRPHHMKGKHHEHRNHYYCRKCRFASNAGHQRRSRDVQRCNLAVYAEARRIYYREVNLNPCKKYPKQVLQRIEWWFWDWFAYDCAVSGVGLTGDESEDLRIELEYGPSVGISPFLALAEFMHDSDSWIGAREIRDFRELDDTNFASMFWIRDAARSRGASYSKT